MAAATITISTPGTYDLAWFNANGASNGVVDASADNDGILVTASDVLISAPGLKVIDPIQNGVHIYNSDLDDATPINNISVHGVEVVRSGQHGFMTQGGVTGVRIQGCVTNACGVSGAGWHGFSCGDTHQKLQLPSEPAGLTWTQDTGNVYYTTNHDAGNRYRDLPANKMWHLATGVNNHMTKRNDTSCAINEFYLDTVGGRLYINIGGVPDTDDQIHWYQGQASDVTFSGCVAVYTHDVSGGQEGHGFCFDAGINNGLAINCIAYDNQGSGFQVNGGDNCRFSNCRAERNARSFNFTRMSTNHSMLDCSYNADTNIQFTPQADTAGGADALNETGSVTFNSMGTSTYIANYIANIVHVNFEGTVGQSCNNVADGWTANNKFNTFDNTHVAEGATSCKSSCVTGLGEGGDGDGGGVRTFSWAATSGKELWYKAEYYIPSTFDFGPTSNRKWHTLGMVGGQRYHNQIENGNGMFIDYQEVLGSAWATDIGTARHIASVIPKDIWFSIEVYTYFHATSGIVRVYVDDTIVLNTTDINPNINTISLVNTTTNDFRVLTYWNGGVPQNQDFWIDRLRVADTTPSGRDTSDTYDIIGKGN